MIKKSKSAVRISRDDWEKMRKNPVLSETVEILEDISDLKSAKNKKGKDLTLEQYLKKRGLRDHN
jgi:hypothetical protein